MYIYQYFCIGGHSIEKCIMRPGIKLESCQHCPFLLCIKNQSRLGQFSCINRTGRKFANCWQHFQILTKTNQTTIKTESFVHLKDYISSLILNSKTKSRRAILFFSHTDIRFWALNEECIKTIVIVKQYKKLHKLLLNHQHGWWHHRVHCRSDISPSAQNREEPSKTKFPLRKYVPRFLE